MQLLEQLGDVDRCRLDVLVPCLGPCEVEQLVDELEQRPGALSQVGGLLRLLGVEVRVREQRREAEDRVHG